MDLDKKAELQRKNAQRAAISRQIAGARTVVTDLETRKAKLEKKIRRYTTALSTIETEKESFDMGKSSLSDIRIESGSWKGQNATKANTELAQMKTSVQALSKKVENALDTIQQEKRQAENELEEVNAQIATQNARISDLVSMLNSI